MSLETRGDLIVTEGNYTLQEKIFFIVGLESNTLLKKKTAERMWVFQFSYVAVLREQTH